MKKKILENTENPKHSSSYRGVCRSVKTGCLCSQGQQLSVEHYTRHQTPYTSHHNPVSQIESKYFLHPLFKQLFWCPFLEKKQPKETININSLICFNQIGAFLSSSVPVWPRAWSTFPALCSPSCWLVMSDRVLYSPALAHHHRLVTDWLSEWMDYCWMGD